VGYLTWAPRQQKEAVQTVQSLGGSVVRESDVARGPDPFGGAPLVSASAKADPGPADKLRELLGMEVTDQVVRVNLGDRQVADDDLKLLTSLANLQDLGLSGTPITDKGLVHVGGLTQLRTLSLGQTNIGDEGLSYLRDLTNLENLNLHGTKITNEGLVHLRGFKKLWQLSLDSTELSDEGLAHLRELPITNLIISNTKVKGAGLAHLAGHPTLGTIGAEKNDIHPQHFKHLADLPNLSWLSIGMPEVTDEAITNLQQLKNMRYLHVRDPAPNEVGLQKLEAAVPYNVTSG
jgi:hypothetical protein